MIVKGQMLLCVDPCDIVIPGEDNLTVGKEYKVSSVDEDGVWVTANWDTRMHFCYDEIDSKGIDGVMYFSTSLVLAPLVTVESLKKELERKNQVLGFIKGGGYTFNKMKQAAADVLAEFN